MRIGDFEIGSRPFIVGEAGINHCGSVNLALEMVKLAKRVGCDAVKFGTFKAAEFCRPDDPLYREFRMAELPDWAWAEIKAECDKQGIIFFSTPQNRSDLGLLLKVGVPCIKVGSDDLTRLDQLADYASEGLPMILSTGMADEEDIEAALECVDQGNVMLLVCTSQYPCPPEDANLLRLATLAHKYPDIPIGFSDHTQGSIAVAVAVALGAVYVEKHVTLDRALPGPDHAFSANPAELLEWVNAAKTAHIMLGSGEPKPTPTELAQRDQWRRKSGQLLRGQA